MSKFEENNFQSLSSFSNRFNRIDLEVLSVCISRRNDGLREYFS